CSLLGRRGSCRACCSGSAGASPSQQGASLEGDSITALIGVGPMASAYEVNFDGLIGPTHNFHALSWGNKAWMANWGEVSNPRAAALEGLEKMKRLHDLGVRQGVLPPLPRPCLIPLRQLGFSGSDQAVLTAASKDAPQLLAASFSASAMWAANS